MGDKGLPLCSQTFFVSQRTGPNKLSLTMKGLDKSKDSSRSRSKEKSSRTRGSSRGRPSSALHSRCGGKGVLNGTMDRYFGGTKDSGSSCIQLESEDDEPSTSGINGRQSCLIDTVSSVPLPPPEDHISKFNEDTLCMHVRDSHKSDENGDSECTMEAKVTKSAFLQNNESNDGVGTMHMTEEDKTDILMCPICWKSFDNKSTQTAHMKLCAVKHKMSTKQLLDALELVQRQEAERKSLGLPLLANKIFVKPKKEPSQSSAKPKTASEGYLQLGLALSASLVEAEREKERNHLLEAGLIEEANEKGLLPTQEICESIPAMTAPIFLNVGKKTGDELKDIPKVRRKNAKYNLGGRVPAILKRTAEERERLITEKVAVILVGDDAGVSRVTDSLEGLGSTRSTWEIRSKEIKKSIDKENIWWTLAGVSPSSVSQKQYYVDSLNEFISPSKIVAGAKLKHLSQIPGRNNTPGKGSSVPVSEKGREWCTSPVNNFPELDKSNQCSSKKPSVKRNLFCESQKVYSPNSLTRDWNLLIGKREMSDITIFTREDREVPAHKLVFYVRCPSVLKDVVEERRGNVSYYMLIWNEACYTSVMAFLKFIYCGELEASTLKENAIEGLRHLAIRYHLSELQSVLDKATISSRSPKVDRLSEVKSHMIKDLPNVQSEEYSYSEHQRYDLDCPVVSPKMKDCEKSSFLNPDDKDTTNIPWLAVESPANRENDVDEIIVRNSTSPSPSAPALSSPDIFHGSIPNSLSSPKSVMVVDEVQTVNDTLDDSNLSQSSRSSIDYLVSLMEKESESSGLNMEVQDSQRAKKVPDQILKNPIGEKTLNSFSESVALENENGCKTPITPTVMDKSGESIVYPTPAPREKVLLDQIEDSFSWKEKSFKDTKRKLMASDGSDSSTPTPKKLCLLSQDGDSAAINSTSTDEKEVVDLTLSSPDREDAAENSPLNSSNVSTIPPPLVPCNYEDEKDNPNDSIRNTSYISNIWDGFDPISDIGHQFTEEPGFGPESDSIKSISVKDSGEVASSVSVISDKCQKEDSPEKCDDVVHEVSSPETIVNVDSSASPKNEEESLDLDREGSLDSPSHEEIIIASNDVDDLDLTEKLLSVSLQSINNSIFWRDENEPVEGVNRKKGSPSTPRTPLEGIFSAIPSNKATPVNSSGSKSIKSANVTPMADFSAMKTPTLHKELDRYGIKHLKRNQAKKILRHIYNELHPIVSTSSDCIGKSSNVNNKNEAGGQSSMENQSSSQPKKDKAPSKTFTLSSDENASSEDGSDSSSDSVIFEESMCDPMESPVKEMTLSQKACTVDLPTGMKILIERNPELHRKILLYEPLWLNDIKLALKEVGAKFNANQLMDFLDEKCITFRLAPGNRHRRKKAPNVKSMPLSQPCSSRSKGYSAISSSQPC